jgi:hypothetical protein
MGERLFGQHFEPLYILCFIMKRFLRSLKLELRIALLSDPQSSIIDRILLLHFGAFT